MPSTQKENYVLRTWLESVGADMAKLEIDREDVHHRKKWRKNVMKRKSNPIGYRKMDYKPIIYIYSHITFRPTLGKGHHPFA